MIKCSRAILATLMSAEHLSSWAGLVSSLLDQFQLAPTSPKGEDLRVETGLIDAK